jgi:hypothetical protein
MSIFDLQNKIKSIALRYGPAAAQRWINDCVPAELKSAAFATLMSMFR